MEVLFKIIFRYLIKSHILYQYGYSRNRSSVIIIRIRNENTPVRHCCCTCACTVPVGEVLEPYLYHLRMMTTNLIRVSGSRGQQFFVRGHVRGRVRGRIAQSATPLE
jgi:hypothetical protein